MTEADLDVWEPVEDEVVLAGPLDEWPRFVQAWLIAQNSPHTAKAYRIDEMQWRRWCVDHGLDPLTAERQHVDAWSHHVRATCGRAGKPAKSSTVRRKVFALSSLYGYLVEERIIGYSPASHVKPPKAGDYSETKALDLDQVERFVAAAGDVGPLADVAARFLLNTGARAAEAVGVGVTDVRQQYGRVIVSILRKGEKRQEIPLPRETGQLVIDYIGDRTEGPLFLKPRSDAAGLDYWGLYRLIGRVGARAKIGFDVTPHVLRATFATNYLDEDGAQIDRLQDYMGHSDVDTTKLYDRGAGALARLASVADAVEARFARKA